MAYRVLEVTLLSANDLKRVNLISRMEVYAVVTISGDPLTRQCTKPDIYGGRHPSWNATFRFNIPPTASAAAGCLHVLLRTERALGDRDVGEVVVPLADLLAGAASHDPGPGPPQRASYQVRVVHRHEPRGTLHVSYRLGSIVAPQAPTPAPPPAAARAGDHGALVAYPVPGQAFYPPPYAYLAPPPPPPPTPQAAAGHGTLHPPANPYHYYHLPSAYYPQAAGVPPAKGKVNERLDSGTGLGAGLVGGAAIGGKPAAGDMTSDVAAYSSGYRAGLAAGAVSMYRQNSHAPQVHHNSGSRAVLAAGGEAMNKTPHVPQAHGDSGYRAGGGVAAMHKQNSQATLQAHDNGVSVTQVHGKGESNGVTMV
ncbi:hypothetical protein ACP70R_031706 [Stipagrostis hirtigluma subsp. patula]